MFVERQDVAQVHPVDLRGLMLHRHDFVPLWMAVAQFDGVGVGVGVGGVDVDVAGDGGGEGGVSAGDIEVAHDRSYIDCGILPQFDSLN